MSDLPQTRGFLGGTSGRIPDNVSAFKEEEMSIIDYGEPARWTSTSSATATESSDLCDIFRVLSDFHFQEPSLPLPANTKDDILTTTNNQRTAELGEPSTSKRKVEELELHKISNEVRCIFFAKSNPEKKCPRKVALKFCNAVFMLQGILIRDICFQGNEQLLTESNKKEKKAKKSRSTESHNMSERVRS